MMLKFLVFFTLTFSSLAQAYSTLDCNSNHGVSYLSHSKVGGARPYHGMIVHIEEIKKENEVIPPVST